MRDSFSSKLTHYITDTRYVQRRASSTSNCYIRSAVLRRLIIDSIWIIYCLRWSIDKGKSDVPSVLSVYGISRISPPACYRLHTPWDRTARHVLVQPMLVFRAMSKLNLWLKQKPRKEQGTSKQQQSSMLQKFNIYKDFQVAIKISRGEVRRINEVFVEHSCICSGMWLQNTGIIV